MTAMQFRFLDNLREAVRENPLSAALIGGGALWLLMGNERLKSAANSMSAARESLADVGGRNLRSDAPKVTDSPQTAPKMHCESSQHASETPSEATSTPSHALSDAADAIKDRIDEGAAYARETFSMLGNALPRKETVTQVQSSFSDLLERQPLMLGAIGLAVGAAVGGAFSTSDLENEWLGELSDSVKEDLNARAGAVSQSVHESSDTFKAKVADMGTETLERLADATAGLSKA